MELADIIQIIISALTLIATIAVSFSIYWLQIRREKELKQLEVEHKAEQFLFDNEEERENLLLCLFANNLHRREKHTRKIYTSFCRCSEELQNEILKQAEIFIPKFTDPDWMQICFDLLRKDIEKYRLGKDVLYDNAKYFHRAFEKFREEKYYVGKEAFCEGIYKLTKSGKALGISNYWTADQYIHDYFDFAEGEINPTQLNNNDPTPPIDLICDHYDWSNCDEATACGCVLFIIKNIAEQSYCINNKRTNFVFKNLTEFQIETFEDAYYEALFWTYAAYNLE